MKLGSVSDRQVPVLYSPHADRLYYGKNEFGVVCAILAGSFADAWEELACFVVERDGACVHGLDGPSLQILNDQQLAAVEESCDCSSSDCGPAWMIYHTLQETRLDLAHFEMAHGADAHWVSI